MSAPINTEKIWQLIETGAIVRESNVRKQTHSPKSVPHHHVDAHLQDGYEVLKKNKNTTRLGKPKKHDELHEDKVWRALASMHFRRMSTGRHFQIPISKNRTKQIDVFAQDEEFCLVVECKSRQQYGRASIREHITNLNGLKEDVNASIRGRYDNPEEYPQIGWILATSNYQISPEDREFAEQHKVSLITEDNIDYFEAISKVSPYMSKQQFAAEIFAGDRMRNLGERVPALRGRDGQTTFYSFAVKPETLVKLSFVQHRSNRVGRDVVSYQRLIKPSRLKKIAAFIEDGGVFPTNLVVNFHVENNDKLDWELASSEDQPKDLEGYEEFRHGTLKLPNKYKTAWVIDGQHRLYAYFHPDVSETTRNKSRVMVTAYENLPRQEEARRFTDINSKQEKVRRSLLLQLDSEMRMGSTDPDDRIMWMRSMIVKDLTGRRESPLFDLIETEEASRKKRHLTFTQISQAFGRKTGFLGKVTGGGRNKFLNTHPYGGKDDEHTVKRVFDLVSDYLSWFSQECKEHWELGNARNEPEKPGGFLCTNIGIQSLLLVLERGLAFIEKRHGLPIHETSNEKLLEEFKPYVKPIIRYFKAPSFEDISPFRVIFGASAAPTYSRKLEGIIHKTFEDFVPEGFEDFLKDEVKTFVLERTQLVNEIEQLITTAFFGYMFKEYGENENEWFPKIRPTVGLRVSELQIKRQKNTREYVDKRGLFGLTDFKDASRDKEHKGLQELFEIYPNDSKKNNLVWMEELIIIRDLNAHDASNIALELPVYEPEHLKLLREWLDLLAVSTREYQPS